MINYTSPIITAKRDSANSLCTIIGILQLSSANIIHSINNVTFNQSFEQINDYQFIINLIKSNLPHVINNLY